MRLNVGCGLDVRDGWTNIDVHVWAPESGGVEYGDALDLHRWWGACETVLLNHVLHLFTYDDAEKVLDECADCLAPGGQLVVVEADVLGVLGSWADHAGMDCHGDPVPFLRRLIADEVEPTDSGKALRWATWHGTRRSMWSAESLTERLERRGLRAQAWWPHMRPEGAWAGDREEESIVVTGHLDRP